MNQAQNAFMDRINQLWPEPQASFEAGLLIGARKGIPPDLNAKFNTTGLSHIIAISGFNITIIIACVMAILKWLPRRKAFWVAVGAIILFTLFVIPNINFIFFITGIGFGRSGGFRLQFFILDLFEHFGVNVNGLVGIGKFIHANNFPMVKGILNARCGFGAIGNGYHNGWS
jgi:hypothetical protein